MIDLLFKMFYSDHQHIALSFTFYQLSFKGVCFPTARSASLLKFDQLVWDVIHCHVVDPWGYLRL